VHWVIDIAKPVLKPPLGLNLFAGAKRKIAFAEFSTRLKALKPGLIKSKIITVPVNP
jgi:hypothetical protein